MKMNLNQLNLESKNTIGTSKDYMMRLCEIIRLMRPKQWIKNLFIFAPLIFSMSFFKTKLIINEIYCFIVFCAISSSIYILNDIIDIEKDKLHPKKKNRPLAKGTVSKTSAFVVFSLLLICALIGGFKLNISVGISIILYFVNNLLYSFKIKHVVIMDTISIAIGFILRVVTGAFAIQVQISVWIIMCTFFIALFLGLGKRRNEIIILDDKAREHRGNLKEYSCKFIDQMISIVVGCTIMSYSLYTCTVYKHVYMVGTIPFVVFGIFRYLYLIYIQDEGGSPTEIVLTDKAIMLDVVLWGIISGAILFLTNR